MITMFKTARFEADLDPITQTLTVASGTVGLYTFPVEIDITNSTITASRENKETMVEELEAEGFEAWDEDILNEYIIRSWEDIIVPRDKNETDAEYALRLWDAADGHASIRECVKGLNGDLSDEELGQPEWSVFELPDGSFVTDSDSDETSWKNADEIREYLQEVAEENRRLEAESRWIEKVFE